MKSHRGGWSYRPRLVGTGDFDGCYALTTPLFDKDLPVARRQVNVAVKRATEVRNRNIKDGKIDEYHI